MRRAVWREFRRLAALVVAEVVPGSARLGRTRAFRRLFGGRWERCYVFPTGPRTIFVWIPYDVRELAREWVYS